MPTISVLLPCYNAEETITQTIQSVLAQRYSDFELLVLDDGSTDGTRECVRGFSDARIQLISCEHDFISTLNKGLSLARGKYVARIDADDLMHPDRLSMQYQLMEAAPELALCASWVKVLDPAGTSYESRGYQGLIHQPELALLEQNILVHPSVMLRTTYLREHGLSYRQGYPYAEDYKLWVDMALLGASFYIEPEFLLYYRVSPRQISRVHRREQAATSLRIQQELLEELLRRSPWSEAEPSYRALSSLCAVGRITESQCVQFMQRLLLSLNPDA